MRIVTVFCGSSSGHSSLYRDATTELANLLIKANLTLVYGGAKVGLMNTLAETMLKQNGNVIGVIPQALVNIEVAHDGLTDLHIVNSMHERKALMADLGDAFILLPGGPGSIDEFFEIFTWGKLGYHDKPFGILNVNHYFDHLIQFIDHSVQEGFLQQKYRDMIHIDHCPKHLLQKLFSHWKTTCFSL